MAKDKFIDVLDKFPLSVCVATLGRGGAESGLAVSWTSPVSFSPLHLMIAVDKLHYSVDLLKSTKNFVLNILRADQMKLAGHFARRSMAGDNKLDKVPAREATTGAAILTDALAYFDCEVVKSLEVGDHLMFIGKVVDAAVLNPGEPLTTLAGIHYHKSRPAKG
ncbi:MAG: flavin reductase family protein [Deltaproteobacteria bacterium]|nr:flavin reductase family protein [Deltaproteobacteria bacterium]